MVKFIIVRHGYSIFNKERKFAGQADVPLDEVGIIQASEVARYIVENFKIDSIYSSDLIRAVQTVKPIADAFKLKITELCELREFDVGIWQGKFIEDIAKYDSERLQSYVNDKGHFKFEGGESFAEVMERAKNVMDKIATENDGKTVLIGTHGGFIRALFASWKGISLDDAKKIDSVPNASVTVVNYRSGKPEFEVFGYNGFLNVKTTEMGVKQQIDSDITDRRR